jgi:hypothetical protein
MKNLLSLILITTFLVTTALQPSGASEHASKQEFRNRFIGAWRLVWLEEPDTAGSVQKANCTGMLVYTRDGHMSVQVMYRNPQTAVQAGPVQYAQGGYEASFGTYQFDENSDSFIFHVEGAMVRGLIGKDLARAYEFSGNQLIVKSTNPNEHWRVAWEHY